MALCIKSIYDTSESTLAEGVNMTAPIRSFIAFDIGNESVLQKISGVQDLLVKTGADLKAVDPANIHITMRFLGDIAPTMVDQIFEQMKKVQFSAFDAKIQGLGAFHTVHYPRVVWAGITEGAEQSRNIFSQLEPGLRGLNFAPDSKGFSPHLTIARVRSARSKAELAKFISENADCDFGVVRADCLRLKQSLLTPKGPIYTTLREHCP